MASSSASNSLDHLTGVYQNVMDDVIRNVREEFLNEAVDLEVLEDLRRSWLDKLSQSGAVRRPPLPEIPPKLPEQRSRPHPQLPNPAAPKPPSLPPPLVSTIPVPISSESTVPGPPTLIPAHSLPDHAHSARAESGGVIHHAPARSQSPTITSSTQQMPSTIVIPQGQVGENRAASTVPTLLRPSLSAFQSGIVPVQTAQGTFMVPISHLMALQNQTQVNQTQVSTASQPSQNLQQTDGPPPCTDTPQTTSNPHTKTQNPTELNKLNPIPHPSSALSCTRSNSKEFASGSSGNSLESSHRGISKMKRKKSAPKKASRRHRFPRPGDIVEFVFGEDDENECQSAVIPELDTELGFSRVAVDRGTIPQLDGADSSSDDDSDVEDDSSEDDIGGTDEVQDDDPLNSDDDDDDPAEEQKDFDTNDTIVCLWEKVYRVRTKWKFLLKDGIMHLGGYDYVFQRGNGEADW